MKSKRGNIRSTLSRLWTLVRPRSRALRGRPPRQACMVHLPLIRPCRSSYTACVTSLPFPGNCLLEQGSTPTLTLSAKRAIRYASAVGSLPAYKTVTGFRQANGLQFHNFSPQRSKHASLFLHGLDLHVCPDEVLDELRAWAKPYSRLSDYRPT